MSGRGRAEVRVVVATGGRRPSLARLPAGALVLDAGADEPVPPGTRKVAALDLLPAREANALMQSCRRLVTSWHSGLPVAAGSSLQPGRAVETAVLIDLAQAVKHLVLLSRLAAREGAILVAADPAHRALGFVRRALPVSGAPIRFARAGALATLRRAAGRAKARLGRGPRPRAGPASRGRAGAGHHAEERTGAASPLPGGRALRVWGLVNYRNRILLEALAADARFSVRLFERSSENAYLPAAFQGAAAGTGGDPAVEAGGAPLQEVIRERIEEAAGKAFPSIPGAPAVAAVVVEEALARVAPTAEADARGWREALAADPPDLVIAGISWSGDLRTLALVLEPSGPLLAACQDGALSDEGIGGIPVASAAFAWGPGGRRWFEGWGLPASRIFEVGDPYLDRLAEEVARGVPAGLRERLHVPEGAKVLLASVQNSAPHYLPWDPAHPVRFVKSLLEAAARAPGWCLILKPHPRLPLVDGPRRLDRLRRLAAEVPNARVCDPAEPIAGLMALADAHVGEGDTLSLEMIRCGKPAIVLMSEGMPPLYPDFSSSGAMRAVGSPGELAALLTHGPPPVDPGARTALLGPHLRAETTPVEAALTLAGRRAGAGGRRAG